MRNMRRKMVVKEVEVLVYDAKQKKERTIKGEISKVVKEVELPEGCVAISQKVIDEKEVVYKMTPETYIKNATMEVIE